MSEAEMRCGDCRAIGVECPRGYFAGVLACDVCGYRFVLSAPRCAPIDSVSCVKCGGRTSAEGE